MRVLLTFNIEASLNPCLKYYMEGLSQYAELVTNISPFWNSNLKFDIINIHWPEELIAYQEYDDNLLSKLEDRLKFWKKIGSKIVVTIHNLLPHKKKFLDEEIYNLIYSYADGMIHLGSHSMHLFENNLVNTDKMHTVIYHPNYLSLPNNISRQEARKKLNLDEEDFIFLSFGKIRFQEEEDMLIEAFSMLDDKEYNPKLIITNSLTLTKKTGKRHPLKRIKYEIRKKKLASENIIIEENKFIEDNDIQIYMNCADVIILPRINNLNSGIIFLAFSFGRLTIGPNIGNINELLDELNNPKFIPKDPHSLCQAMNSAFSLINSDIPQKNYLFAKEECDIFKIGKQYIRFFEKILNKE